MASPLTITVIGAGAIGGWLAAALALGGQDVTVVLRRGGAVPDGLTLIDGGVERTVAVRFATSDEAARTLCDVVLICTKATSLAEAAVSASGWIGPGTLIVPLQNGVPWWFAGAADSLLSVDHDGRIAAALPVAQVIGGVVHAAARRVAPGATELVHTDSILLGEPCGGGSARVDRLVECFRGCGIPARANDDIRSAIWYKAWGNMTINPVSALTGATGDRIVGDDALRPFLLAAMAEAAEVGAAYGCPISESGEARLAVTERLGAFKTSMLQDAEAERPLEHQALIGAPRELASRAGISTPMLDALHALIAQRDAVTQSWQIRRS